MDALAAAGESSSPGGFGSSEMVPPTILTRAGLKGAETRIEAILALRLVAAGSQPAAASGTA